MKVCRTCKETKELTEFGSRKYNRDGLNSQCKICEREYQKQYKKGHPIKSQNKDIDTEHIDMKGLRKSEWCETYRTLSKIGYNPDLDIHSQFIQRHPQLTLKSRPRKNILYFTWQDCK